MSASCDRSEHDDLLPLQHLVEHLRWGCTDQAQQAWLLEAVFKEHAHQLAERQRALPLSGVEAGVRDALANLIDPKETP